MVQRETRRFFLVKNSANREYNHGTRNEATFADGSVRLGVDERSRVRGVQLSRIAKIVGNARTDLVIMVTGVDHAPVESLSGLDSGELLVERENNEDRYVTLDTEDSKVSRTLAIQRTWYRLGLT